ncbi:hypothetical protein Patl1_25540 [Pistacia atlantica]|uniref:Uncharacterized protein n=1 Tax=Pistacia atlantica TaxID=434234 RepID=A0ACC1B4Z9_9ROSI|nr:hypothetical protein Patl1_25540 [Pistacia atlantica]
MFVHSIWTNCPKAFASAGVVALFISSVGCLFGLFGAAALLCLLAGLVLLLARLPFSQLKSSFLHSCFLVALSLHRFFIQEFCSCGARFLLLGVALLRWIIAFVFEPMWEVLTGRKDGNIFLVSEANGNLHSPFSNYTTLQKLFASKGLSDDDLVALSGGHTIGVARCGTFSNGIYNFTELDPKSSFSFDGNYFNILLQDKGLLQSDAALLTDKNTEKKVKKFQKSKGFFKALADSIKKLGSVGAGNAGEFRKKCRLVNPQ